MHHSSLFRLGRLSLYGTIRTKRKVSATRDLEWWFKGQRDKHVLLIASKGILIKELIHPLTVLYPLTQRACTCDRERGHFLILFPGTCGCSETRQSLEEFPGKRGKRFKNLSAIYCNFLVKDHKYPVNKKRGILWGRESEKKCIDDICTQSRIY